MDQIIAAVTGCATLATAVATFLTVREMAKQRKAAVQPELVAEQQYAFIYAEQPTSCLRHIWSRTKIEANQVLQHSGYAVPLTNLGTGAAKQVRAEWSIDIASMAANVNTLAREVSIAVSAEIVPGDREIRILWPDKVTGHQLVGNQLTQNLGYLLPVSISTNSLQVSVPSAYLSLASLQVALGLAAGQNVASAQAWLVIPPAQLAISYADVNGESRTKEFHLVLELLSAGHQDVAHNSGQLPTFMTFMVRLDERRTILGLRRIVLHNQPV